MKKLSTLLACVSLCLSGMSYATLPTPFRMLKKGNHHETVDIKKKATEHPTAPTNRIPENIADWHPTRTDLYKWEDSQWELAEKCSFSYTPTGKIQQMAISDPRNIEMITDNTYNQNDQLVLSVISYSSDGEPFTEMMKLKFEYDDVLTNVVTLSESSVSLLGQTIVLPGSSRRIITRNDAGNITEVVNEEYEDGQYKPEDRIVIEYSAEGKAISITQYSSELKGDAYLWEKEASLTEVTWEETDGQIYDIEKIFQGNNRIKTAKVFIADLEDDDFGEDNTILFDLTVNYNDVPGYYEGIISLPEFELQSTITYEPKENGGYSIKSSSIDGETEFEEVTYDEWGNMLSSYSEWSNGNYNEIEEDIIGLVEYDDDGFPILYIVEENIHDPNSSKVENKMVSKTEFFDYINVTAGVGMTETDVNMPIMYFNLQGQPVTNPEAGSIYIRKKGAKAEKVMINNY